MNLIIALAVIFHIGITDLAFAKNQDTPSLRAEVHCALALSTLFHNVGSKSYRNKLAKNLPPRMKTCVTLASKAEDYGLSIPEVVAIGYYESKFSMTAVSSAGAIGPLQILPRYFCPKRRARGCDVIAAGLKAVKKFKNAYGDSYQCHYNAGRVCNKRSKGYARRVRSMKRLLEMYDNQLFNRLPLNEMETEGSDSIHRKR